MHNPESCRFEHREGDALAVCEYRRVGELTLEFDHTFVPDSLRGRGIAAVLAEEALSYARDNGFKVVPSCSYIAAYVARHPAYAGLVVAGG